MPQQCQHSVLIPLSSIDRSGVRTSGLTLGYVLKGTLSVPCLEAASSRICEKWRLLAGRIEWNPASNDYAIRVPMGPITDTSANIRVTTSTSTKSLDFPVKNISGSAAEILVYPSVKFFRHPSSPSSIAQFASSKSPVVCIHVSFLSDYTCIGIAVPHGMFDGIGAGMIIHALDCELNGKTWTPPPLFDGENALMQAFEKLGQEPKLVMSEPSACALEDIKDEFGSMSIKNGISLVSRIGFESLWHKQVTKSLFIGSSVLEKIVGPVKAQALKESRQWVSTGDILASWLVKTGYKGDESVNDSNKRSIVISYSVNLRKTLSAAGPLLGSYPHNTTIPITLPPRPISEVHSTPLSTLAIVSRERINAVRTPAFVNAWHIWAESMGAIIPLWRSNVDAYLYSNQVECGFTDIHFGESTELVNFWFFNAPLVPDHTILFNKMAGGYVVQAGLRRSRWEAIEKEIERLKM